MNTDARWNRHMDSIAPTAPPRRYIMRGDTGAFETVNCDTQPEGALADTSIVEQRNNLPETANMFTTSKTDYVVFFALAFALVAALIG